MPSKDKYDLSVLIKGDDIFFELNTFNPGKSKDDKLESEVVRVEMRVARIFHKLINNLSLPDFDKSFFQKDDYKLLGEILGKIVFSSKMGQIFLDLVFPEKKEPPECLRIYLEINNNSQLAELPWEYTQVWPGERIARLGEQNIYLAANEKSRFQLIRRLNKLPLEPLNTDQLNVVLVISNKGNNNEDITSRDSTSILDTFQKLQTKYPNQFNFIVLDNPEKENFTKELVNALKKFKRESDSIPPYCIHYFGHSRLINGEGELVFKTKTLPATWIKDDVFAGFFDRALLSLKCNEENESGNDLQIDPPSAVLFQSCDSGKIGDLSRSKGVAVAMAKRNIPAVIGMQNEIDPTSSSAFSYVYYKSLLDGCDVAEAITAGRYYLGCKYNIQSEKDIFGNNEFGSPVLFINTLEPITLVKKQADEDDDVSKEGLPPKKRCLNPNCNAENDVNAKFCIECGQPFRDQKVGKIVQDEGSQASARKSSVSSVNVNPVFDTDNQKAKHVKEEYKNELKPDESARKK